MRRSWRRVLGNERHARRIAQVAEYETTRDLPPLPGLTPPPLGRALARRRACRGRRGCSGRSARAVAGRVSSSRGTQSRRMITRSRSAAARSASVGRAASRARIAADDADLRRAAADQAAQAPLGDHLVVMVVVMMMGVVMVMIVVMVGLVLGVPGGALAGGRRLGLRLGVVDVRGHREGA